MHFKCGVPLQPTFPSPQMHVLRLLWAPHGQQSLERGVGLPGATRLEMRSCSGSNCASTASAWHSRGIGCPLKPAPIKIPGTTLPATPVIS